jgi:hypothetical protein
VTGAAALATVELPFFRLSRRSGTCLYLLRIANPQFLEYFDRLSALAGWREVLAP